MPYSNIEELPQELQERLPQHAQQIFMAAFNASQSNGMSEEDARQVAWNSVRIEYEQGEDGKWYKRPEDSAIHDKAITTGGN